MAEATNFEEVGNVSKRRRIGSKNGGKDKKGSKAFRRPGDKTKKVDNRMKKLFKKRARDYNSDEEEEDKEKAAEEADPVASYEKFLTRNKTDNFRKFNEETKGVIDSDGEDLELSEEDVNEDADDEIQPGIAKFLDGCRAFKTAFNKIINLKVSEDSLGPVLSAHKELIAEKLAEDDAERKFKGEAKKEKHLLAEKNHVQPANFLDTHEKFLIGVSTKGAVKLFNAVNKAQNAQKGLDPSRFKDAKELKKKRKEAFFSELRKKDSNSSKASTSGDGDGPAWAPLRDNYMLTNSKLKNWDKMEGNTVSDDTERIEQDSSSDESD